MLLTRKPFAEFAAELAASAVPREQTFASERLHFRSGPILLQKDFVHPSAQD
jgi:hypothetical protein